MKFIFRTSALLILATCLKSFGQGTAPEVRRAIPVHPEQIPTAIPVATPLPMVSTPTPEPTQVPASQPSPDENGTIRLAPGSNSGGGNQTSPANSQLEAANGFYSRKMYDLAIPEYEKYLIMVPTRGEQTRQEALFRLAESHRFLENLEAARDGYERLLSEFNSGAFTGAAAYRLAEILYGDKNYDAALQMFRKASANTTDPDVKLTARFYEARSLDFLKRGKEAEPIYLEISTMKGKNNPYRDFAKLYLASNAAAGGRKQEALDKYLALSAEAEKSSMRTEAAYRAANLALELGQKAKARDLYNKVAKSDNEELSGPAKLASLHLSYDLNDYKTVTSVSLESMDKLPGDALPDAILLVANSYRQMGEHHKSAELYDRLLREFPNTTAAHDARFQRIVNLYSLNDKNASKEIDDFLLLTSDPKERSQANLLKAELLFKDKKFAEAGKIYADLETAELADNFKADALYKLGWCQAQVQDYTGAAETFTKFLKLYPQHEFAPTAIAQRALCAQQNKDYDAAIRDFNLLIEKYPKAPERELALQQKALLFGQQEKNAEMTATFEQLLKEYPKSAAAPQANFWLGKAAFDKEDYAKAVEKLNLARTLDPSQYGDRSTLRILLAYYKLQDREATAREITRIGKEKVPPEIYRWLGTKYIEEGNYAKAEQFLLPLTKVDASVPISPEIFINLANAQLNQKKWKEALDTTQRYLDTAHDPVSRARGMLAYSQALIGMKKYEEAQKSIDEAMLLQPEGRWNAEARMIQAEASFSKGDYEGAARQFMTIALLYDDKEITPRALLRAHDAFQKANNSVDAEKALRELTHRFPSSVPQTKLSSQKNP